MERNKKKLIPLITLFVLLIPVVYLQAVPPAFIPGKLISQSYQPDRVLVKFRSSVSGPQAMSDIHKENLNIAKEYQVVSGLKLVTIPPGQTLENVISRLSKNPNVEYVEPDYLVSQNNTNDTSIGQLWAFNNTAQTVNGVTGTTDADMNVFEAWTNTGITGDSAMVIAVIDSGVKYDHPDLVNNMWVNPGEVAGDGI
ncbi:MAG: hypothetical protein OEX03_03720, partial [Gammaproteobacteria bacterium]|nr:hypothetical protein [Gammaproteobacteria bacterium]